MHTNGPLIPDCMSEIGPNTYRCRNTGEVIETDVFPIHHRCKSRGLGDTIAKITTAIGIKPCRGCKQRQKKLNELFPYKAQ